MGGACWGKRGYGTGVIGSRVSKNDGTKCVCVCLCVWGV